MVSAYSLCSSLIHHHRARGRSIENPALSLFKSFCRKNISANILTTKDSFEHILFVTAGNDGSASSLLGNLCCKKLSLHSTCTEGGACPLGIGEHFICNVCNLLHHSCILICLGISCVYSIDICKKNKKLCIHLAGTVGAHPVVVSKVISDFRSGDHIVFIEDRNYSQIQEDTYGGPKIIVALPVVKGRAGNQDLGA